jgi:hypothetical protein
MISRFAGEIFAVKYIVSGMAKAQAIEFDQPAFKKFNHGELAASSFCQYCLIWPCSICEWACKYVG